MSFPPQLPESIGRGSAADRVLDLVSSRKRGQCDQQNDLGRELMLRAAD
jgi:hypothetical protein